MHQRLHRLETTLLSWHKLKWCTELSIQSNTAPLRKRAENNSINQENGGENVKLMSWMPLQEKINYEMKTTWNSWLVLYSREAFPLVACKVHRKISILASAYNTVVPGKAKCLSNSQKRKTQDISEHKANVNKQECKSTLLLSTHNRRCHAMPYWFCFVYNSWLSVRNFAAQKRSIRCNHKEVEYQFLLLVSFVRLILQFFSPKARFTIRLARFFRFFRFFRIPSHTVRIQNLKWATLIYKFPSLNRVKVVQRCFKSNKHC